MENEIAENDAARTSAFARIPPAVRFPVVFVTLSLVLFVATAGPLADTIRPWLCRTVALHTHLLLNLVGEETRLYGAIVSAPLRAHSFDVIYACTSLPATLLLVAAVFAFPAASWRFRVLGILAGVALLYAVNLARLVVLFYCYVYWPDLYDRMHATVWQSLLVVVAVAFFVGWASFGSRPSRDATA